tara:strand:- start:741 stop:1862 length:1122 start_codon:yes stop_codon:yes gene_type:complete
MTPIDNKVSISLIGDVALNGLFVANATKNRNRFLAISNILNKSDLVFANLETGVKVVNKANELKVKNGGIIASTTEDVLEEVSKYLNISAYSIANNHIYDYGDEGVKKTIEVLSKNNIHHSGAGYKEYHTDPVIINQQGIKIAFLAFVDQNTNPATPSSNSYFINYFDEDNIASQIKNIRNDVDYIIVSIHWGVDYSTYPTIYQTDVCKKFIDIGANIIMGHHTHTLQPFEKYNEGYIFYSLGQLCYGDYHKYGKLRSIIKKTKKSVIIKLELTKNSIKLDYNSTKELIGNKIILTNKNYLRWSAIHLKLFNLKSKYSIINFIINVKENFIDRINEYFFGYYLNPFSRLFQFQNLKKINYLFRDYKKNIKRDT